MTNAANITGVYSGASAAPPVSVSAVSPAGSSVSKPLTQAPTTSISPRIVADPTAGIIVQYLSRTGQIQSQIPSATVVAYLRAGLTAQGLAKPQNTEV